MNRRRPMSDIDVIVYGCQAGFLAILYYVITT